MLFWHILHFTADLQTSVFTKEDILKNDLTTFVHTVFKTILNPTDFLYVLQPQEYLFVKMPSFLNWLLCVLYWITSPDSFLTAPFPWFTEAKTTFLTMWINWIDFSLSAGWCCPAQSRGWDAGAVRVAAGEVRQGTWMLRSWPSRTSEQHSESVSKCLPLLLLHASASLPGPKRHRKVQVMTVNTVRHF